MVTQCALRHISIHTSLFLLHFHKLCVYFYSSACDCSAEPNSGGPAWHHQAARRPPAVRHRIPDTGHDHAVHLQGKLPHPGCHTCQHEPSQL